MEISLSDMSLKLPHGCLSTLKQAHDVTVYHSHPPPSSVPLTPLFIVICLSPFHLQLSELNCT